MTHAIDAVFIDTILVPPAAGTRVARGASARQTQSTHAEMGSQCGLLPTTGRDVTPNIRVLVATATKASLASQVPPFLMLVMSLDAPDRATCSIEATRPTRALKRHLGWSECTRR